MPKPTCLVEKGLAVLPNSLKIRSRLNLFMTIIFMGSITYACDSGGSKKAASPSPAPAGTCSGTKKSSLALQSSSSGLQVSYEKATENGKDISSTGSIKAVLAKYCTSCHKSGGIGAKSPPLTTFSQAKTAGGAAHASVKSGEMPPGNASAAKTALKYFDAWKQAGYPETLSSKATGGGSTSSSSKTGTSPSKEEDEDEDSNSSSGSGSGSQNNNSTTGSNKNSNC
jgi:hypothetical protein